MSSKQTVNLSFWFFFFFFIIVMMTGCMFDRDLKVGSCYSDYTGDTFKILTVGKKSVGVCKYIDKSGYKFKQCDQYYNELHHSVARREEVDCPERLFPNFEEQSGSTESN